MAPLSQPNRHSPSLTSINCTKGRKLMTMPSIKMIPPVITARPQRKTRTIAILPKMLRKWELETTTKMNNERSAKANSSLKINRHEGNRRVPTGKQWCLTRPSP